MTKFTWRRDAINDELKIAVGSIILDWALIDDEITTMLSLFWTTANPNTEMPISLDRRIDELLTFGREFMSQNQVREHFSAGLSKE